MATLRLNHVSVQVCDLERSASFYRDVLRLSEIDNGTRKPNIRWFGLGPGQSVHLIEGDVGATFVTKSTHFCIATAAFGETLEHLRRAGVAFGNLAGAQGEEHRRADGVRSVYLQDPDGYWIEVNEDF